MTRAEAGAATLRARRRSVQADRRIADATALRDRAAEAGNRLAARRATRFDAAS